jgi:hypothetical protein
MGEILLYAKHQINAKIMNPLTIRPGKPKILSWLLSCTQKLQQTLLVLRNKLSILHKLETLPDTLCTERIGKQSVQCFKLSLAHAIQAFTLY